MKTIKQDLGKVSVTCNGTWDGGKEYYRLSIVNDGLYASYISKKFVPSGIPLSNIEYWQPLASLKDDIKINYEKFKKEVLQLIADIQIALRGTRLVVQNEAERNELTWMQVAVGCEVYEIDSKLTYILDSIVPILNIKEWHLESDSRIDSVPMYELEGTFDNLTSDRAIADRWGHIIDEYYVTRDMVNNYIKELVQKYVHEFTILPGSIKPEDLSQAVLDLIGHDSITNLADEEDITDHTNANGTHVLKFKDKDYYEADGSGLGRVYLRQNKVQGVNTLTQDMISKPNTIYHIQYDYTLQDQIINLPINSVLLFNGGSINCGTLVGNNSKIIASKEHNIFGTGIIISGNWNIADIYDEWFAFDSSENFVSNDIIKNILALGNDNINNTIHFEADRTYYFELPYKGRANLGNDVRPDYWKLHTEEYSFLRIFTGVTSNTHLIFNNILQMLPTNQGAYAIFFIENKENIKISGIGSINGEAKDHLYTDPFVANSDYFGEWGYILCFRSCNNIAIRDITLKYSFGDNISFSNAIYYNNDVKSVGLATKNVLVDGVKILYARRNGISLGGNNYSIINVYFEGCGSDEIKGTAPKCGIDFENDYADLEPSSVCSNVTMSSCKFKNNKYDISSTIRDDLYEVPRGELVNISDCNFTSPLRLNRTNGLTFNNCHIVGITNVDNSIAAWYVSKDLVFNNCIFDELNPYLVISAEEQDKKFINPTYPEDIRYTTTFQHNMAVGKALKFTIPKPLVGEVEFTAFCSNSNHSFIQMPINTTVYTFGPSPRLTGIRDVKIKASQDNTPRYPLYKNTPVFSYINYTEDTNNFIIYFTIGGSLINDSLAGSTSVNIFLTSKTKFITIEAPVSGRPDYAGIYGGKWSQLSSIVKESINVSDIPETVTFPSKELYEANLLADMPSSLTPDKVGKSVFVLDDTYRRPAFWDSYSNTFRTADGNRLYERTVTSQLGLDTLTAKLDGTADRGYIVYITTFDSYLTWDGARWLNEDGSLFSKVKFIKATISIDTLNILFSYNNVTYKIVGNIDLGGGELTITSGSTLDFQGGSITNGTINFNNTNIIADSSIFTSIIFKGVLNCKFNVKWYNILTNNDDNSVLLNELIVNLQCSYNSGDNATWVKTDYPILIFDSDNQYKFANTIIINKSINIDGNPNFKYTGDNTLAFLDITNQWRTTFNIRSIINSNRVFSVSTINSAGIKISSSRYTTFNILNISGFHNAIYINANDAIGCGMMEYNIKLITYSINGILVNTTNSSWANHSKVSNLSFRGQSSGLTLDNSITEGCLVKFIGDGTYGANSWIFDNVAIETRLNNTIPVRLLNINVPTNTPNFTGIVFDKVRQENTASDYIVYINTNIIPNIIITNIEYFENYNVLNTSLGYNGNMLFEASKYIYGVGILNFKLDGSTTGHIVYDYNIAKNDCSYGNIFVSKSVLVGLRDIQGIKYTALDTLTNYYGLVKYIKIPNNAGIYVRKSQVSTIFQILFYNNVLEQITVPTGIIYNNLTPITSGSYNYLRQSNSNVTMTTLVNKTGADMYIGIMTDNSIDIYSTTGNVQPINNIPILTDGGTIDRPTLSNKLVGYQYYDNDLKKPIWWDGTAWKDATGATV